MDNNVLLIQVITLLYWESHLDTQSESSAGLVREVLEDLKIPEATLETDHSRDIQIGLRATALYLCDLAESKTPIDRTGLLLRVKLNTKGELYLYEVIDTAVAECDDQTIIRKRVIEYSQILFKFRREKKLKDTIRQALTKYVYAPSEGFDPRKISTALIADLEPFTETNSGTTDIRDTQGMVDAVNFENIEDIERLFEEARTETSVEGLMRTGYQAVNRMLYGDAALRRGDTCVVAAMQHNWKSGFCLNITRQIAMYNKPHILTEGKKPLILHISAENQLTSNLLDLYQSIVENETGEYCDTTNVDEKTAARLIKERMSVNGYHFQMMRVNPSEFNYRALFNMILWFESEGYEIHLLVVDYLAMMDKTGCTFGPTGAEVRDLFRRCRNFCSARKITLLTPHQIAKDAVQLLRNGTNTFVKELVGKTYYQDCKSLVDEVDVSLLIHIEKVGGRSYLTIALDKHRKSGAPTPEEHRFTVLPFYPIGAVRDDLFTKDSSMRKAGADANGDPNTPEGEDSAWFISG